jgi:hypothetical protein
MILIALEPAEAILIQEWQALGDAAGQSVINDPHRAICGIATVFGQPSPNDRRIWKVEHFQRFLDLEIGIPLRIKHGSLITNRSCIRYIGTVRRFAAVEHPVPGLLVLAELDDIPELEDILVDLVAITSQRWLDPAWGMSLGALVIDDEGIVKPYEVSLTRQPAFPDAAIISVGERALSTFDLLTERRTAAGR